MYCTADLLDLKFGITVEIYNSTKMFGSHLKIDVLFMMSRTKDIAQEKVLFSSANRV